MLKPAQCLMLNLLQVLGEGHVPIGEEPSYINGEERNSGKREEGGGVSMSRN